MIVLIVRGGYVAQQPRMRGMQGEEDGSRALGELGTATADHRAPPNRAYATTASGRRFPYPAARTTASAISFGYRSPLMCSQPRPARGSPVLSAPERDGQPPSARSLTSHGFVLTCRPGPRRPSQHPFPFRFASLRFASFFVRLALAPGTSLAVKLRDRPPAGSQVAAA